MARIWLAFSSLTTTALLGIALAVLVSISAFVPQGWLATRLAGLEHSESIRTLYVYGLTNVAESPWLLALGALLVGNLVAVLLRLVRARRAAPDDAVLARAAPCAIELDAPFPERAVEQVRSLLARLFGRPVTERVEGARVLLAFETAPRARLTPLTTHAGLVLLLLGAVLSTRPPPPSRSMVRTVLEVRDSRSPAVGTFDLAEDEVRSFFQWRAEHVIRDYAPQKDGLGPAIRMERIDPELRRVEDFWVYLNAPPGFDARHRKGEVSIIAKEMGLVPRPGAGLASRPEAVLLLLGLGLLGLGALELGRPDGRLVVEAEGRRVRLAGVPHRARDPRFFAAFERWAGLTRYGLGVG